MIFRTMMRSIALAAILGALLAAGAFYAAGESDWRNAITVWLGASERAPTAALTSEDWPICTVMGSMIGSEADWARLDPDFAAGKKPASSIASATALTASRHCFLAAAWS
jgi:hypothetical protein